MREILYQAKRKDNWEWVEGLPSYGLYGKITELECMKKIPGEDIPEIEYIEIDPETLCQYTGLTDKNARKIFEGDILSGERYHDWGQGGEYQPDKCVIKWNDKRVAFDPVYWWDGYNHNLKHYEVSGNIFDNPEIAQEIIEGSD